MPSRHPDPAVERLWTDFHASVNMGSHELRAWLLTDVASESGLRANPDPGLREPGRQVVDILGKRKMDLTDADLAVMARVVERVQEMLADPPPEGPSNSNWRHELMSHGYDPLREPPERSMA